MHRVATGSFLWALLGVLVVTGRSEENSDYERLREAFAEPDHAVWGEVPLWWWEGAPMTEERLTAQLEELAAKGVKSVCPIQRSPGRCDPQSFEPAWWDMLAYVHEECRRLGMTLWAYDQVGYGHYGWLEKAAARVGQTGTARVELLSATATKEAPARLELPEGTLLGARAYPVEDGAIDDAGSLDLQRFVQGPMLEWTPREGTWRVAACVAVPMQSFYLSADAAEAFVDMLYGKIERTVGKDAMGRSFAGVFQDEHPPTPRDVYTEELARRFQEQTGYELARAIPALHFDVGPRTPQYRTDYFDVYLGLVEETYWKRVYDWTDRRKVLTSHDNWGRNSIHRQSEGYIDYFRSQRWFSAPGYDDAGQGPLTRRNYYDTKIAASIARLYGRPRVWNEAFHSSGWGRTTDQTLVWLSTGMAFGANLYDEHGLYYATRASTWEHAAPDPHWRQPYWQYYGTLSDWVARTSHLMSQGRHVVDAAVHYPVVSLLAGEPPGTRGPDYDEYMRLSRVVFDAGIDNDIVDDDSILDGAVRDGKLWMGGNGYQALVFGPETTVRRSVLERALALAEAGGTVLFFGRMPTASTESGRGDPELAKLTRRFGGSFGGRGFSAFVASGPENLPRLLTEHMVRDVVPARGTVYTTHRRVGDVDVYLVQNAEDDPLEMTARFRVDAVPEMWDPFTGETQAVMSFVRDGGFTTVTHRLEGNTAHFIVFRPGEERRGGERVASVQPEPIPLGEEWEFSVVPTRNNRWGEFRWPPGERMLGPEVRQFRYRESDGAEGLEQEWHAPELDDGSWPVTLYSTGPRWLCAAPVPPGAGLPPEVTAGGEQVAAGHRVTIGDRSLTWREIHYSKTIGAARAAPWGGHSGYPDGHVDKNFVHLPEGRKLLFTRLRSPEAQRLGLRVELRNEKPRLWVNGTEQPFEDAVGNLPLRAGENAVLLDLPDGGHGRLFVQRTPPAAASMVDAARGSVTPDLRRASWVWSGDTGACYVRKRFELTEAPAQARVIVSAFSGYRLFINGRKVGEEIGPWSNWKRPETFTVTPYLEQGDNVVAVWGQLFAGQNVNKGDDAFRSRGIVLALAVRNGDGTEQTVVTDATWKGTTEDHAEWESPSFDDRAWNTVTVCGRTGDPPWGLEVVENVGAVTEPHRPLSIHLDSPYLTCFEEVPEVVYDVKPADAPRVGWYRFSAPPGLRELTLPTRGEARVWVDGVAASVRDGKTVVATPPRGVSTVAVRVDMPPGEYAGAAFAEPPALTLEGGVIGPGSWKDHALPTYSGIGAYTQRVTLRKSDLIGKPILDLGQVRVAAEVFVNGTSAGVRLARPFTFDLSGLLEEGENTIEVRVANTIAPHYTTIPAMNLGPTDSGLLGPVRLVRQLAGEDWRAWGYREAERLNRILTTVTPELEAARRGWEKTAGWQPLEPARAAREPGSGGTHTATFPTSFEGLTGVRLELLPHESLPGPCEVTDLRVRAIPPEGTGVKGRFVRIAIEERPEYLALAEVEVLSGGENIARSGTARQSSTSHGGHARLAIDGNRDGHFSDGRSVTHTNPTPGPWWELDLGAAAPIEQIEIWNRMDGDLHTRLRGFVVSVLDADRRVVWQRRFEEPPNPSLRMDVSGPVTIVRTKEGWSLEAPAGERAVAVFETAVPFPAEKGALEVSFDHRGDAAVGRCEVSVTRSGAPVCDLPPELNSAVRLPPPSRTERIEAALERLYLSRAPALEAPRRRLQRLREDLER